MSVIKCRNLCSNRLYIQKFTYFFIHRYHSWTHRPCEIFDCRRVAKWSAETKQRKPTAAGSTSLPAHIGCDAYPNHDNKDAGHQWWWRVWGLQEHWSKWFHWKRWQYKPFVALASLRISHSNFTLFRRFFSPPSDAQLIEF